MNEQMPPEEDLTQEFRNLGKNLAEALRTAWEHPERKRLQEEITNGLNEMGDTLKQEAETFAESPTAQQLKSDVQQIGERVRSPEVHTKVRQELLTVLQTANNELQKVVQQWSAAQAQEPSEGATEDPPGDEDPAQEA